MFYAQTSVYGCWHAHPRPRLWNIDSQLLSWRVRKGGGGGGGGDGCGGWGLQRLQQIYLLPALPRKACFQGMERQTHTMLVQTNT